MAMKKASPRVRDLLDLPAFQGLKVSLKDRDLQIRHTPELEAKRLNPQRFRAMSTFFSDLILAEERFLIQMGWELSVVNGTFSSWTRGEYTTEGRANIFTGTGNNKLLPVSRHQALLIEKAELKDIGLF